MKTISTKSRDEIITLELDKAAFKEIASEIDSSWIPSKSDHDILDAFNQAFNILKGNTGFYNEPKTLIITTEMFKAAPEVFKSYLDQNIRVFIQDNINSVCEELTKENSGLFPELYDTIILDE